MRKSRKVKNIVLKGIVWLAAFIIIGLVVGIVLYILIKGLPGVTWAFLSTAPNAFKGTVGILPSILNTFYMVIFSLLIALPIGIGAAIYLNEYAQNRFLKRLIEFTVETLAGIPSILYGLVGMLFFAQMLQLKTSILSGSLTLVIMILPTVIRTTQEALNTVPKEYREGALALGGTKWYIIRTIVLPSSLSGIVTGAILAIGRIVGESAALLFTAGVGSVIADNVIDAYQQAGGTLSVMLYVYVSERAEFEVGFSIAAVLLILVFILNILTKLIGKHFSNKT